MIEHEPCASRGDCYHSRNGRKSYVVNFKKWIGSPEHKEHLARHLARLNSSPEQKSHLARLGASPEHKAQLAWLQASPERRARRVEQFSKYLTSPEHKAHLVRLHETTLKTDTKPELKVKAKLDELVAMKVISGYEHPYSLNNKFFVDFYVPDFNTIIEVDGCYWHKCAECGFGNGRPRDNSRNAYIKACGYKLEIVREHELK